MNFQVNSKIRFTQSGKEYEAIYGGTTSDENGVIVLRLSNGMLFFDER